MLKIFKLKGLRGMFSTGLSIDLGTSTTRIWSPDQGMIINDPSYVVVRQGNTQADKEVLAVGVKARQMLGRMPLNMAAIRPLKDGVIADFQAAEKMLEHFIHRVYEGRFFKPSPKVLVCVPAGATQMERRAIRESVMGAGASSVFLIDKPIAAAIGADIPIEQANGSMVVDIGAGTTEIAIISLSGIVYSASVRVGGDRFDEAIIHYVRRHYGCLIGLTTAERIKLAIGTAYTCKEVLELEVRGRSLTEGTSKTIILNSNEIREAFQECLGAIINGICLALEQIPPELSGDIAEKGILLTGGGALLRDLDKLIMRETGLSVTYAEDPLSCVARGGSLALEMMHLTNNKQQLIIQQS